MIDTLTGTVSYTRKVQPKQYEASEAGIFVQFEIDGNATDAVNAEAAKAAFRLAKEAVLDELNLLYVYDAGGYVREGGATGEQALAAAGMVTQPSTPPTIPPTPAITAVAASPDEPPAETGDRKADNAAMKAWALQRIATHPNDFFDNRAKKQDGSYKPNAPDFKHKGSQRGVWLS